MRSLVFALLLACGGSSDTPKGTSIALDGRLSQLTDARRELLTTLEANPSNGLAIAGIARIDGLSALSYGVPVPQEAVFAAVAPDAPGFADWALGKVAFELTHVDKPEQLEPLTALLARLPGDPWKAWLEARIALARGDRVAASALLRDLAIAPAKIDYALLLADEGKSDQAEKLLATIADNPLAQNLRGLFAVEQGDVAFGMPLLVKPEAPRILAYRTLAEAFFALTSSRKDPQSAAQLLGELGRTRVLPNECAFWERVAWLHLQIGRNIDKTNDHKIAGISRMKCAALGKATGENQRLLVVDANLQLGIGRPDVAKRLAARAPSLWGKIMLAYAELELGNPAAVPPVLANPEKLARPESVEVGVANALLLHAQAQLATGAERSEILTRLQAQQRASTDLRIAHALGAAHFATGDLETAQQELRAIVELTSATRVDPFGYRTRQLLAEIAIAQGELTAAGLTIDEAIKIHPGNTYSRVLQARIRVRAADSEGALAALAPLRKAGELSPAAKLVVAEALVTLPAPTDEQRAQAKALVLEVVGKLAAPEVGRVAALIDPKLPGKLELPVGKLPNRKT